MIHIKKGQRKQRVEELEPTSRLRIQLDLNADQVERLDELVLKTGAATRAELIRRAIRVYEWLVTKAKRAQSEEMIHVDHDDLAVITNVNPRE